MNMPPVVRACYEQSLEWTRKCGSTKMADIAADYDEVDDYRGHHTGHYPDERGRTWLTKVRLVGHVRLTARVCVDHASLGCDRFSFVNLPLTKLG